MPRVAKIILYRHITYRTESENMNIVSLDVGFPPVWGDLDRCIFRPGAFDNSY